MKNIEHWAAKQLVGKFVTNPNWPRELKISYKLLNLSPDLDSWLALNLPRPLSSLAFFLTNDGQTYIPSSNKNPYLLDFDKLAPKSNKRLDFSVN